MPSTPDSQDTLKVPVAASSHLPDLLKFAETDRHGIARSCPRAAAACKPVIVTSVLNIPVPDETTSRMARLSAVPTVKYPRKGWLDAPCLRDLPFTKALPAIPVCSR
jgi:hypothetical protein